MEGSMDKPVIVELTAEEALKLQSFLYTAALAMKEQDDKKGEKGTLPADMMKISMKVTMGLLGAFLEGGE